MTILASNKLTTVIERSVYVKCSLGHLHLPMSRAFPDTNLGASLHTTISIPGDRDSDVVIDRDGDEYGNRGNQIVFQ